MWNKKIVLLATVIFISGCSSFGHKLKSFLSGEDDSEDKNSLTHLKTYSQNSNIGYDVKRNYQHMTRQRFEEESQIHEGAGSLWSMSGQGSYLFSQNFLRTSGDLINIQIEGSPKKQLITKVDVIKKLIKKLSQQRDHTLNSIDSASSVDNATKKEKTKDGTADSKNPANLNVVRNNEGESKNSEDKESDEVSFDVSHVPARIIERLTDGNYRVKGSQNFMIGRREYKVIVTGIARAEDIQGDELKSSSLLDPKFEIMGKKNL